MKKTLVILSLLALVGAGCTNSPAKTPAATTSTPTPTSQSDTTVNGQPLPPPKTPNITFAPVPQKNVQTTQADVPVTDIYLGEPQTKFNMEVSNSSFSPATLTAKPGEAVEIIFTKATGTHSFVIDGTDANFVVKQGAKDIFTVPAKPGSYQFYSIANGAKEKGMVGTLLVK